MKKAGEYSIRFQKFEEIQEFGGGNQLIQSFASFYRSPISAVCASAVHIVTRAGGVEDVDWSASRNQTAVHLAAKENLPKVPPLLLARLFWTGHKICKFQPARGCGPFRVLLELDSANIATHSA